MKFLDLVLSGCDFSGTSTQIEGMIDYFKSIKKTVRDLRGTEIDAMFHAESIKPHNNHHTNLNELKRDPAIDLSTKIKVINDIDRITEEKVFKISSMVKNDLTEYIDPNSADVWIMEEPTHRGAGQTVRGFELYRSKFGDKMNLISASLAHQAYRSEEFFRFRGPIRKAGKNVIRSRSEESACYQIKDREFLPDGISREQYLSLPGHQIAFGNPPTNIFVVVGPENWKPEDYLHLRRERSDGRILDDNEKEVGYQLFVNKRYATDWIDNLYKEGCDMYESQIPEITRFSIYDSKEEIIKKMTEKLESILDK